MLIVGCGCRGRALAADLIAAGQAVRGTTRDPGRIEQIEEVPSAIVELVWDPPWSREMMSEAAQLELGLM